MEKKLDLFKACLWPEKLKKKKKRKKDLNIILRPSGWLSKQEGRKSNSLSDSGSAGVTFVARVMSPFYGTNHRARCQSRARQLWLKVNKKEQWHKQCQWVQAGFAYLLSTLVITGNKNIIKSRSETNISQSSCRLTAGWKMKVSVVNKGCLMANEHLQPAPRL